MIKNRKSVLRGYMLVTQLGLGIIAPIFLCIFIGHYLDTRLGWKSMLWLLILGFLAGARNGWLLIRTVLKEEQKEEQEQQKEQQQEMGKMEEKYDSTKTDNRDGK